MFYKYRYFKVEKPNEYRYFRIKKSYKYKYSPNLTVNKVYNADKILKIFCNNNNEQINFYFI